MNPYAAAERAQALLDLRRPEEALEHLGRALATDPENPRLHCLAALAHLRLGNAGEALEAADAAVAVGPELEWAHRLRALALLQSGRKREARDAALEAARLAPELAVTHIALAGALQAAGDEAGALAAARHAVALDPEDPDTHSTLAEILFEQDRPHDAIGPYQRALALDPEDADTINNLAVARLRAFDGFTASEQFEAAARLDPRHEAARHNILHTGTVGTTYVLRRFSVTLLVIALAAAPFVPGLSVMLGFVIVVLEFIRAAEVRKLNPPTRALLDADRRARRFKPRRWDWSWPTRIRPWWWVLLTQMPPPLMLTLNVFFLAAGLLGQIAVWVLAFGLALPFSIVRFYRWLRRRRPAGGSWRPPA